MIRYPEKIRILLTVSIGLILAIAVGRVVSPEAKSARSSRGRLLFSDSREVDAVEIADGSSTMTFRRFGGAWILDSGTERLPARSERVEAFLEVVQSVHVLAEAARSESAWPSLGLDENSSRRVRLFRKDGEAEADFRVGRYSQDGSSVYIRRAGDPKSYAIVSAAASRLPASRKAWLDLRLLGESVPVEDVQRLRVSGALRYAEGDVYRESFTITRSASKGWTSDEIPDLDPSAAGRFIRAVMNAEAEDFTSGAYLSSGQDGLRLDLELGGGTLRTLRIAGSPDEQGEFSASLTGAGRVLGVGGWTLRNLLKTPEELQYKARR